MVKYSAYQNSKEYFEDLYSKFGDMLKDKEDGVEQIIKYLEEKFGVSQHSEIVRKLMTSTVVPERKTKNLSTM